MKIALLTILGLLLGMLAGALIGIGVGIGWVELFDITSFEGQNAMTVFFAFMPGGAILGGLAGAVLLGVHAARSNRATASAAGSG
jgi:hypothetical protein